MNNKNINIVIIFICFFLMLFSGNIFIGILKYPEISLSYYIEGSELLLIGLGALAFTATFSPVFKKVIKLKKILILMVIGYLILVGVLPLLITIFDRNNSYNNINKYFWIIGIIHLAMILFASGYLIKKRFNKKKEK